MRKKGFTLVELLAVIVILGIILLIAVPKVISTINGAKLSTLEDTVKMVAASAEREYVERNTLGTLDQVNNPIECSDVVNLSADDYSNCTVDVIDDVAYVNITGAGKFTGLSCSNGTRIDGNCSVLPEVYEESILNGAYPRITDGMIPVRIANNGTVTTVDSKSSTWYSYTNKEWANVVLVKETGTKTRSYYQSNTNVIVDESDILAYLVWIPRYRYTLFNVEGNEAIYSAGACTSNCPQSINITFEDADTAKSTGTTNGTQLTHPAFTYGGVELNGIWVGKFETTQGTALNVGTTNPTIKPNITSWLYQSVSEQFTAALLFGTDSDYELNGESRMTKNSDWGAIVYLSHSQYGINTEIRINNNSDFTTGCGANVINGGETTTCQIQYGAASSYPQSTTGNMYGVFDINGGAWEYQMGEYTDSSNNLYSGTCDIYTSGFKGIYGFPDYDGCNPAITSNTTGLDYPNSKYYKLYEYSNWQNQTSNLGDALGETNAWYEDRAMFPDDWYPWFLRGGSGLIGSSSGSFSIVHSYGSGDADISFRTVVTTS